MEWLGRSEFRGNVLYSLHTARASRASPFGPTPHPQMAKRHRLEGLLRPGAVYSGRCLPKRPYPAGLLF